MKIGYFITQFPYSESSKNTELHSKYPVGGAEVYAENLAREMVKLGHDIQVFATSANSKSSMEARDGMRVYHYGTRVKIAKAFLAPDLFFTPIKYDVDLIHVHFAVPPADLAGLHYLNTKRKPCVVTYHGDLLTDRGSWIRRTGLKYWNKYVVDDLLSKANCVICNSVNYMSLSKVLTKFQNKVIAIPPGINIDGIKLDISREACKEKLGLSTNDKVILFVGHLIGYKSPDVLIKAMPDIIGNHPETKLVLVGDGPLRNELEKLSIQLNLSGYIKFAGFVPDEVKKLYYKAADIFTLPSTTSSESFGIVLLEAAAAGLPIVVSSLDTFRAFIKDGYNGLIARSGDADSLAQTINRLLSDEALMAETGKNARASVSDYSWENTAHKFEKVYEQVLSQKI